MTKAYKMAKLTEHHVRLRQQFTLAILNSNLKKACKLERKLEELDNKQRKEKKDD